MKNIPGYEGLYAATEDGQIWSYKTQKFLKLGKGGRGYLYVNLSKDGNIKTYTVHRLIALTYISNPDNLLEVDHIDRNKSNNSVENLRWVTHSENNLNRDMEQFRKKIGRPVEMRDKNNHDILIKTYPSVSFAATQEFGDARKKSNINKCAHGERQSAYGYFWTFAPTDAVCE